MELLDEESQKVLEVIDYAESTGLSLTAEEFVDFARAPVRKSQVTSFSALSIMSEKKVTETVLDFLTRTKMIEVSEERVRLTRLGQIVLKGLAQKEMAANAPQDVVLAAGDSWASVDLLRAVRRVGNCLVVDPYCREPQMYDIARHTTAERVLIGPQAAKDDFALLLGALPPGRPLDLRVSGEVHDRFYIPEIGPVLTSGASINSVGQRKPTILVELTAHMSAQVRATYEEIWGRAISWSPASAPSQ